MAEDRGKSDVARREEEILAFWKEHSVFEKTLAQDAPKGEFVFYDGPPFATGLPHQGSLLSSVSKDVVPRYKTMRGYRVRRRWGWDTHGLPIESLVEKKLGLKNKKEILALGIEEFNETARAMVLEYVHEWKRYVERVGRFVDFDNSYKTMDNTFIESVWWGLKEIHKKNRLYEGRKVLMYCPHCETPLAKAEIAMDNTYKDVTEETATVAFKVRERENTYLLAWTTTPWTLPGNVALAVGPDIDYVTVEKDGRHFILAKERLSAVLPDGKVVSEEKGSSLVGLSYEPLYEISKVAAHEGKKWTVLPADFVTIHDGTGVVHTAVIYGEDDYALGLKEGLPMVPLLNPNATYNDDAPEFLRGQYIKKAEPLIKEDLEKRGILFAREMHTHSYPHCYRCGTPLIYNAVSSWFIDIQSIKDKLRSENEHVSWAPDHLKHGRFMHIVENAPDWTISRNRFWASPLPIWKDAQGNVTVIGSLEELKERTKKNGNAFLAIRHGESENFHTGVVSSDRTRNPLTEKGRSDVLARAQELKGRGITKIYSSPLIRTKETAEIIAKELELEIVIDERLHELSFGVLEEKTYDHFFAWRDNASYDDAPIGGESYEQAKQRFGEFLYEKEAELSNETVLVVTHGVGLESFSVLAKGLSGTEARTIVWNMSTKPADVVEIPFVPLPHNRKYELDFHLPYIDRIQLVDEKGETLTRIPEVVDCWVESGSMPFAEYHYPFENKEEFEKRTPGDFVSEYIGQTRAWFYYMHAISVSLFNHAPFRNVVTTGTVLAGDGAKLSKSKGNYTDPYVLFDQYGADAFRFYLMGSVVMQAEDLTFRDEDVKEAQNRVVNMMRNIHAFYGLYKQDLHEDEKESSHVLDRWILARLAEVIATTTDAFDRYDIIRAVRPMREFIDDLSTWYVRRSRDRIKSDNEQDKQAALRTLRHVLCEFSKIIAPVMPFVAEEIYLDVKRDSDPESVHLTSWPQTKTKVFADFFGKKNATQLITDMKRVRTLSSTALMERQKVGVKVRQPLGSLSFGGAPLAPELRALIAEELNVKEVRVDSTLSDGEVKIDATLTPELIAEGDVREFARALADARKAMDLAPRDRVTLVVDTTAQNVLSGAVLPGTDGIAFENLADAPYSAELSTGRVGFSIHAS